MSARFWLKPVSRLILASFVILVPYSAEAALVALLPSGDQWIRSTDGGTAYTSDAISIRDASITGDARWGILQFDLSGTGFTGADLISASLNLNVRSNTPDAGQNAFGIDITSGTQAIDSITWNQYQTDHAGSETPFASLGHVAAGSAFSGGAIVTTSANASELATIASTVDGAAGSLLTLVFAPNSANTNNDWTDGPGQLDNRPSVLRLEFVSPGQECGTCDVPLSNAAWLRDSQRLVNDGVLVTNNAAIVAGVPTYGLLEWDLSDYTDNPANLASATLTFTVAEGGRTTEPGQVAGLIDTTGGTTATAIASRQAYDAEYMGSEAPLEGLGVVPDTTASLSTGDTFTTLATAADLDLIRAVMNGSGLLTMAMFGSDFAAPDGVTGQYWGDGAFGAAPVLTLSFVPEPTTVSLLALAGLGAMFVRRRRQTSVTRIASVPRFRDNSFA